MRRNFGVGNRPGPVASIQGGSTAHDTQRNNVIDFLPVRLSHPTREASRHSASYSNLSPPPEPFVVRHPFLQAAIDVLAIAAVVAFIISVAACILIAPLMLIFGRF